MKYLIAAILLCVSSAAYADCDKILPFEEPAIAGSIRLCRAQEAYLTVYNPDCKVPYYSAEEIDGVNVNGRIKRKDNFREDEALPENVRSTLVDYRKSGFDRGHIAPAADFSTNEAAMSESFLLSNMVPQYHNPNAGMWLSAELHARELAVSRGYVKVVSGPLFNGTPDRIGNGVCVPTSTFKIIVEPDGRTTSYIIPNVKKIDDLSLLPDFIVPLEEIEQRSGILFK